MIHFTVSGNPQALKRHRTVTKGRGGKPLPFPMQYDPSKNDKADFLAKCMRYKPETPLEEPLSVILLFSFARPNSHFGTGRNSGILKSSASAYHVKRPDLDNLVKFVLDALNGIFWKDDTYICRIETAKNYSEKPGVTIQIKTLD